MNIRTVVAVIAAILIAVWIAGSPARAGNDIHSLWTSAVTFFQHLAGTHS